MKTRFDAREIVIILNNIRSIHNVGSVFRTADAAGVKRIYLTGITPAPVDRLKRWRVKFSKVSLGAEKYLAWEKVGDLNRLLIRLKLEGYRIYAVEQSKDSIPYHKAKPALKTAVIVGNEIKGLPGTVLRRADRTLEIPMFGKKESLNVAVAFGIIIYHLRLAR